MVKIEAIIRPFKLDEVKAVLQRLGIEPFTTCEIREHGGPDAPKTFYRGTEYRVDAPKVKVEALVSSLRVEEVVEALAAAARTTVAGDDGTILIHEIADAIRIRSGQRAEFALS